MICYDLRSGNQSMILRVVLAIFVAVVLLPRAVAAAEVAGRWRATAVPPRAELPTVEIDLGYANQYVPAVNAPADFRARAVRPFDGYIGYHFASGVRQTPDTPVVARAVLGAHSQWRFSTTIHLARGMSAWIEDYFRNRELVIEWRDREMNLIARRSVGAPPWVDPPKPLRIVSGDASSVSDSPQWYGGFSSVVIPFALWFELPRTTREAIFKSAVRVVFVGVPERVPPMDAIDRALLPVDLRSEPSVVDVPWPYDKGERKTIPAAVAWRAKSGAGVIGSATSPYIVTSPVATFVADEKAPGDPLPSFAFRFPRADWAGIRRQPPTLAEILGNYRPALFFLLLAVLSIGGWLTIRHRPHVAAMAAIAACTMVIIGARNAIRPAANTHTHERLNISSPGVVDVTTAVRHNGPAPRRVPSDEIATAAATRVIGGAIEREGDDAEVRTSQTPPGFGDLHLRNRPWTSTERVTVRRELGNPATVRIRSRDAKRLIIEYDSTIPVDYVAAQWISNDRRYSGEAHAGSRRGVAKILAKHEVWSSVRFWSWTLPDSAGENAIIELTHVQRDRTVVIRHTEPSEGLRPHSYSMYVRLRMDEQAELSATLCLPAPVARGAMAVIGHTTKLNPVKDISAVILSGSGGVTRSAPSRRAPFGAEFSAAEMQQIAPAGGVIKVSVETTAPAGGASVELRVRGKSQ